MNTNMFEKSVKSGISGASAMTIQVSSLMWLRTTMNYQYKFGGSMYSTITKLYNNGGIQRFYKGYIPALIIGPISRFGDTFTNELSLQIFNNSNIPLYMQTGCASMMTGAWRVITLPLDTWKTSLQVHGNKGIDIVKYKIQNEGIRGLYNGSLASSTATIMGHFPWFVTYNYMNLYIPRIKYDDEPIKALGRNALIGFCSSFVSDTVSNSMRVIKTYKQTHEHKITYKDIVLNIKKTDGIFGLMFRGLQTKIFTNGLQGIIFSIFYKFISEKMEF